MIITTIFFIAKKSSSSLRFDPNMKTNDKNVHISTISNTNNIIKNSSINESSSYNSILPSSQHLKSAESAFITAHVDQLLTINSNILPYSLLSNILTFSPLQSTPQQVIPGTILFSPLLPIIPISSTQAKFWITYYKQEETSFNKQMVTWLECIFATTFAIERLVNHIILIKCYLYFCAQCETLLTSDNIITNCTGWSLFASLISSMQLSPTEKKIIHNLLIPKLNLSVFFNLGA